MPNRRSELTASIVSAFVSNNQVRVEDLEKLIASTYAALTATESPPPARREKPVPPIPIKRSVTHDYLISLEDGRRYKSLKRHLSGRGLSPEQYRAKWDLPVDYPMTAPSYALKRSELAKASGLGMFRKRSAETPKPKPAKMRKLKAAPTGP